MKYLISFNSGLTKVLPELKSLGLDSYVKWERSRPTLKKSLSKIEWSQGEAGRVATQILDYVQNIAKTEGGELFIDLPKNQPLILAYLLKDISLTQTAGITFGFLLLPGFSTMLSHLEWVTIYGQEGE